MKEWHCPAKINLYLAITGIRETDGFHELDSLVSFLDFGDTLKVEAIEAPEDLFESSFSGLDWDEGNLIYRAIELYRNRTGFNQRFHFQLRKAIPLGAGLGGGSSDASTALKAVNQSNPHPVSNEELKAWSAEIGSDCPLFFESGLVRMRGRGEVVEPFQAAVCEVLKSKKVLLFHPGFEISAAWAYKQLRRGYPAGYTSPAIATKEIDDWRCAEVPWDTNFRNDLLAPVGRKYVAIAELILEIEQQTGVKFMMSGSGSSCYCIVDENYNEQALVETVYECWGKDIFFRICRFLP